MKKKLLIAIVAFYGCIAFGQRSSSSTNHSNDEFETLIERARTFAPNGVVRCATVEYHKDKQSRGMAVSDDAFEAWLAPKIEEIKRLRLAGRLPSVIRIPVVVHVIHNGDPLGSNENIANGQVLSQITVFNQDFRRMSGTPGFGAGVDTTIEFCLAQVDPNGNPTTGIDRVNRGIATYNSMNAIQAAKTATIWDPTKYLNMWTFAFGGGMSSTLGYAQFPSGSGLAGMGTDPCVDDLGGGNATTDGVVCNYNTWGSRAIFPAGIYAGTQYDKGRTMTHEVGHVFGLRHTWGDGDCTVDDFCADTPNCSGDYYAGVDTGGCIAPTQCGVTRQIQNYMDYSDDSCMNIFTQNQKDRMLAVLMNSPRRDDLLVSTVCEPNTQPPYIQFKRVLCEQRIAKSVVEGNGCGYTQFTVPVSISKAASANAVVTFSIDALSVANASDIQIITPTVTFNSGLITDQNFIFRVLNDAAVELDEDLIITFSVNPNGGNAAANPYEGTKFNMTIVNDDTAVVASALGQQIFYEGFESYTDFTLGNVGGWTTYDLDGDPTYTDDTYNFPNEGYTGSYIVFNPSATTPSAAGGGYDAHSGNKGYYCYNESVTPFANNDWAITPQISLGTNSQLKLWAKSLTNNYNGGERFRVLVSTTNTNTASFTAISAGAYITTPLTWTEYTYNLSAYNNQNIYIAIQCVSSDEFVFMLDDVSVTSDIITTIETNVNTPTAISSLLSGAGTTAFKDTVTRDLSNVVTLNDASNYGCAVSSVTRSGTSALQYGSSTNVVDFAMSKQFTITPGNNVSGNATITFYFTEAEIAGWETTTGNNRSLLYVARDGVSREVQPLTIGSFGTGVTLTATFTGGIQGVYSFARQQSLPTDNFEFNEIGLFPNPNNGTFNIQFTPSSEKTNVVIFDVRGRVIFDQQYQNNGLFNESIQLDNIESGIYLVKIQDGSRKVVKKIVVQ
jgi:hypothetical protein